MSNRVINFDMDGVLSRFTAGAKALHGIPGGEPTTWNFHHEAGLTDEAFYRPMDRLFAAGLGVWEDGMSLLALVREYTRTTHCIHLLSSPWQTFGCEAGKRDWVNKNTQMDSYRDLTLCSSKHVHAGPGKVLVDDSDKNVRAWCDAGGAGWLVPRPWNALASRCDKNGLFNPDAELPDLLRLIRSAR